MHWIQEERNFEVFLHQLSASPYLIQALQPYVAPLQKIISALTWLIGYLCFLNYCNVKIALAQILTCDLARWTVCMDNYKDHQAFTY